MGQAGAELEELSVFTAVGGLTAAAAGGVGVFAIGAAATLGVASGAAALLGEMASFSRPAPASEWGETTSKKRRARRAKTG